jgi:hypothetical protein
MSHVAPPRALVDLPSLPEDVRQWRILLLVSAVNSLTQRVATYLSDLGCERVSTELALSDDSMTSAVIAHSPHVVICPFLVKKVPEIIYSNVSSRGVVFVSGGFVGSGRHQRLTRRR